MIFITNKKDNQESEGLQTIPCPHCQEDVRVHMPSSRKNDNSPSIPVECPKCGEPLVEKVKEIMGEANEENN